MAQAEDNKAAEAKDAKDAADSSAADDAAAIRRRADALYRGVGIAALTMSQTREYGGIFLGDLRRVVAPPVALNQYRIVQDRDGNTAGFFAWAKVGAEVRERLMVGRPALRFGEWQSGGEIVVMVAAATSDDARRKMLRALLKDDFVGVDRVWLADPFGGSLGKGLVLFAAAGAEVE